MNDALLYSDQNSIFKTNTKNILDTYLHLANLQENSTILDVGAGDGSLSIEVLFPRLPHRYQKFVLCDISQEMVNIARQKYTNPKIEVRQLDIATRSLSQELVRNFNHVFSFTCLNWLPEESQLQAFKNIFNMLKPGGTTFFTLTGKFPFFDIYEIMAQFDKWKFLMRDYRNNISLYHYLERPEDKLKFLLEKSGFQVNLITVEKCVHSFLSWKHCISYSMAVNPYNRTLPSNKRDQYIEDFTKELKNHNMIIETGNKVCLAYDTIVACATKT